ncbi:MAG: HWE histidine kinase domain-containing protein [Kiloniellaceae bacterium]
MPDLSPNADKMSFIAGSGEMVERIRKFDWAGHPFGPTEDWPQSLRSALSICLHSAFPTAIYWGPELRLLYNDAWAPIPGPRHPAALGKPAQEVWDDIWDIIWPQFRELLETGEGFHAENQLLPMRRYGFEEETYWNYSFTAIRGEDGRIAGIFNTGFETTEVVLNQRRLRFKLAYAEQLHEEQDPDDAVAVATALLGEHLQATHVGYWTPDSADGNLSLVHGWADEGRTPAPAGQRLASFGAALAANLAKGQPARIDDVESYNATESGSNPGAAFAALAAQSAVFVPWMHGKQLIAVVSVMTAEPRRWNDDQVLTLQEAIEVAWETVEILRNEQRQDLLMREVNHRAKNALAVVQAVVRLSQADDIGSFREVVEGRISALARTHDLLAESRWMGLELLSLAEAELRPFASSSGHLQINGPRLRLRPELAQAVALALHELATNAAKYGALKGNGGTLAVSWQNDDGQHLILDWHETTIGPVAAPSGRRGFGSELLEKSIHSQLGGRIDFDWAADGLKCRLDLPLRHNGKNLPEAADEQIADRPASVGASTGPNTGAARVLLAEDEPLVAMDLEARLEGFGYAVFAVANSVAEALQALEGGLPDVALLDANLHGESSVPVALELHRRGVPVVFITGYDKIDGLPPELTSLPRLSKPILDNALRSALDNLLDAAAD